jgi:hypothetical protein
MPIRPFLTGRSFDAETTRAMGAAFECAKIALNIPDGNPTTAIIAENIIELAQRGERDSERLCDLTLAAIRGRPSPRDELQWQRSSAALQS